MDSVPSTNIVAVIPLAALPGLDAPVLLAALAAGGEKPPPGGTKGIPP